jgi:hypothetical protein
MQGVERLALVAKVLMDTRLLELKRENEALKLQLFWRDHNPSMLRQAMAAANMVEGGPRCACLACIVGGRCADGTRGFAPYPVAAEYDFQLVMSTYDRCHLRCQFKPWFEAQIREAGMRVGVDAVQDDNSTSAIWGGRTGMPLCTGRDCGRRLPWQTWSWGSCVDSFMHSRSLISTNSGCLSLRVQCCM